MHNMSLRQGLRSFSAKRRRMVSRDRPSCSVSLTISPASSSSVQRLRPLGGAEQAVATRSAGTVGNLVRGAGFPSGSDEAIAEHDGKLGLSLGPFAGRHFPLLSDLAQDQENELGRRLVAGEMASRPHG